MEAEISVDIAAIERAFSHGVKADPLDNLARLRLAGDMGHDDAGRAPASKGRGVIVAVAAATHANEGIHIVNARGADLIFEAEPIIGHVFRAQPDGVETAKADDLDDRGDRPG